MKMITAMTIKSNPQITPVAIEEQKKENNRGNFLDPALAIFLNSDSRNFLLFLYFPEN